MFLLPFLIGMIGFFAMVALGALRGAGGHAHAGGHVSHSVHAGVHAHVHVGHAAAHTASHVGSHSAHAHSQAQAPSATSNPLTSRLLSTLSPVNIFSLCLGFGATGIILGHLVAYPAIFICAVIGALVFSYAMVNPLMDFIGNFATKPSEGIEGTLYQEAEAITGFDESGKGIVRLTLDGQHVQLLATLDELELQKGIHVKKGEKLIVIEVDSVRNTCRVTRELAS